MIISDVIKKLCKYIIYILDTDTNKKYVGDFIPILYKHKYSSSLDDTIRIKNGDDILKLKNMKVNYKCPNCNKNNLILLKRFLSKKSLKCSNCREDEEKIRKHSEYIQKSLKDHGVILPKNRDTKKRFYELDSNELIELSIIDFNKESESFKSNYFNRVKNDLENIKVYISENLIERCDPKILSYSEYFQKYESWDPTLNKEVLDFIDSNKDYLISNFFDKEKSDEENMKDLIDYYTKYPEEMKTDLNINNIKKPTRVDTIKNMTPKLINIGVNGFKSIDRIKIK